MGSKKMPKAKKKKFGMNQNAMEMLRQLHEDQMKGVDKAKKELKKQGKLK